MIQNFIFGVLGFIMGQGGEMLDKLKSIPMLGDMISQLQKWVDGFQGGKDNGDKKDNPEGSDLGHQDTDADTGTKQPEEAPDQEKKLEKGPEAEGNEEELTASIGPAIQDEVGGNKITSAFNLEVHRVAHLKTPSVTVLEKIGENIVSITGEKPGPDPDPLKPGINPSGPPTV